MAQRGMWVACAVLVSRSSVITLLRHLSLLGAVSFALASMSATGQTTFGSGTQVVIPTAANISVYHTQVFVRNPNPAPMSVNVLYYQSTNGTPPAGLRSCAQVALQANQSASFDLGTQCGLTGTNDDFGMILLEDAAATNPFFAYSRTQTPDGIGFSVEGFPIDNFSGAPADVLGLEKLSTAPNYRSNCFISSLAQSVNWQLQLVQSGTETVLGTTSGSLAPYQTTRILDVFSALGLAGNFANVRATFTTPDNPAPPFIRFCTLETSANGSADFRIAKSSTQAVSNAFLQGGNAFGTTGILGTTDNQELQFRVNNLRALRIVPDDTSPILIGCFLGNGFTAGASGATVAGGGAFGSLVLGMSCGGFSTACRNNVTDAFGTVGGGAANLAGDAGDTATDRPFAAVGGGFRNKASGAFGTVAGGDVNTASGIVSTVLGGETNLAAGNYSTVGGYRAVGNDLGMFVWADYRFYDFDPTIFPPGWPSAENTFNVRATGGLWFVSQIDGAGTPSDSRAGRTPSDHNVELQFRLGPGTAHRPDGTGLRRGIRCGPR